jgi:hypothetical protein
MVNISTRGFVGGGAEILIAGFVIEEGRRQVLIRGVGPSLVDLGVTGFLDDPVIFLRAGEDEFDFLTNDDWESATNAVGVVRAAAQVGAFPLRTGSRDAALLVELDPGLYTVRVRGKSEVNGIALVEVYEVRWPGTFSPP